VLAVAIAPEGSWLATAGGDGTVRIWDSVTGAERHTLTGHTVSVQAVAIAPDSRWLATAGSDHTVRLWDPITGAQRRTLTGHSGSVQAVAITTPDGSWLATDSDDYTVRIWDPATGTAVASSRVSGPLAHHEWSGMTVVAVGAFGPYIFKFSAERTTR
jgi:WD40 repeat protein